MKLNNLSKNARIIISSIVSVMESMILFEILTRVMDGNLNSVSLMLP